MAVLSLETDANKYLLKLKNNIIKIIVIVVTRRDVRRDKPNAFTTSKSYNGNFKHRKCAIPCSFRT